MGRLSYYSKLSGQASQESVPPHKILPSDADHVTQNALASRNNEAWGLGKEIG